MIKPAGLFLFALFLFLLTPLAQASEKIIFIDRKNETKYLSLLFKNISQKNICLISNQAGIGRYLFKPSHKGQLTYLHDFLAPNNIRLIKVFTPEHGLSSQAESDGYQADQMLVWKTPIYPIYYKSSDELTYYYTNCEAIVFDLPDSGIRPYTYRTILTRSIQAVAKMKNKPVFYLIDNPNPASFLGVKAPVTKSDFFSYIGEDAIPFFPEYTYVELMRYYISRNKLQLDMRYIAMPHYRHDTLYNKTFIPPSPSIPHLRALHCYWIGIFFEGTTLDYGRYTKDPFCLIGHPDINFRAEPPRIRGIKWKPFVYRPFGGDYSGRLIRGYSIEIENIHNFNPVKAAYEILEYFIKTYPEITLFKYKHNKYWFDKITGSDTMRTSLLKKQPYWKWFLQESKRANHFRWDMAHYRIY